MIATRAIKGGLMLLPTTRRTVGLFLVAAGHRLGVASRVVLGCRIADLGEDESFGRRDEHGHIRSQPGVRLGDEFGRAVTAQLPDPTLISPPTSARTM